MSIHVFEIGESLLSKENSKNGRADVGHGSQNLMGQEAIFNFTVGCVHRNFLLASPPVVGNALNTYSN